MIARQRARGGRRRAAIVGVVAVVIVLALAVALRGGGGSGSQASLDGSWRSNDPVQNGINPPRTITFSGADTVVLGQPVGLGGRSVQDTPPLHYTRPDASHISVAQGPISLNYSYTLTNNTLTLSTGSITFTYHHA